VPVAEEAADERAEHEGETREQDSSAPSGFERWDQ
jgi:hypothetical protein